MSYIGICIRAALYVAVALAAVAVGGSPTQAASLRVGTFGCDITPPPGEPLVWATKLVKVEQPLQAKGIVLEEGTNRYVLCALDWCLVCNETHSSLCQTLAAAAGTEPSRVAVQCLHQHAAPYADEAAYRLLESAPSPLPHLSSDFLNTVRSRLSAAAAEAVVRLEPFDRIGTAQVKAERLGSARRLHAPDGKILTRYSSGAKDPKMAAAPEGPIDPLLKTITLARGHTPLVRLHYYASHPQTFCCDGRASSDFVGLARESVEQQERVFQIYFTGCSGDVTVGKYNDGSPQALAGLTERLEAAMRAAARATRFAPASSIVWRTESLRLPLREGNDKVAAQARAWLNDPAQGESLRVYEGAMRLAYFARADSPVLLNSLQIGHVHIVHLPGEPMLEFQLFAQRERPKDFVAVAGYGECGTAYICTDQAIVEGGYEPSASNVGKGSELRLKQAIQGLLGPK